MNIDLRCLNRCISVWCSVGISMEYEACAVGGLFAYVCPGQELEMKQNGSSGLSHRNLYCYYA
jgi:hypothetical protein